jgi:hypothetical protein
MSDKYSERARRAWATRRQRASAVQTRGIVKGEGSPAPTRALSIRQPYAELILRRIKKFEYRTRPTSIIGERFYVYASLTPGDPEDWATMGLHPGELPTGVIVGTVEVDYCKGKAGDYKWHLKSPKRLRRNLRPRNHPQPGWFKPF